MRVRRFCGEVRRLRRRLLPIHLKGLKTWEKAALRRSCGGVLRWCAAVMLKAAVSPVRWSCGGSAVVCLYPTGIYRPRRADNTLGNGFGCSCLPIASVVSMLRAVEKVRSGHTHFRLGNEKKARRATMRRYDI